MTSSLKTAETYWFDVIVEGSHEVISGDLQLLCPFHVHLNCRGSLEMKSSHLNYDKLMGQCQFNPLSLLIWNIYKKQKSVSFRWVSTKESRGASVQLSIYWLIYAPTLIYGLELWVVDERMRSLKLTSTEVCLGSPLETVIYMHWVI